MSFIRALVDTLIIGMTPIKSPMIHLSEMKGDVGMSPNEKEREQEDAHPNTESHSTSSPHLCFF